MAPKQKTTIRLGEQQLRKIRKLSAKLGISQASVIRMAIERLALQERLK